MMGPQLHHPVAIRWQGIYRWGAWQSGDVNRFYGPDGQVADGQLPDGQVGLWLTCNALLNHLDAKGLSRTEQEQAELDLDQLALFATDPSILGFGTGGLMHSIHLLGVLLQSMGSASAVDPHSNPAFARLFDTQWEPISIGTALERRLLTPADLVELRALVRELLEGLQPEGWPDALRGRGGGPQR